jgi:ATP-binding cassette subfamily C protein LapB
LHHPQSGRVLVDGIDQRQMAPDWWRSHIGYVGQEPQLFMGSLRDNLVLANTVSGDAPVLAVLDRLGLIDLVRDHPRGLDRPLSEAGGGLSGGQRQLLSVARMMLRDPRVVFLDEPTAHMDQATETRVVAELKTWLAGRTVLLATHRPQLLELVDTIVVLDGGRCLAQGPRDEIIERLSRGIARGAA